MVMGTYGDHKYNVFLFLINEFVALGSTIIMLYLTWAYKLKRK